ncbi:hypothetical protein niasHS_011938 [Heterodera schachtii]|uniref:Uncharacterized protein n=1 Tax=Heterodera schachtii TaxID=97005 RepID=A0ABD2IY38_HETSC
MFCLLGQCYGLMCKDGHTEVIRGYPDAENVTTTTCYIEQKYCVFVTCAVDDSPGYALSAWYCGEHNDETYCAEKTAEETRRQFKNVRCKCEIGEPYKDMTNDKPKLTLPPPKPTSPPTPTTPEPPSEP